MKIKCLAPAVDVWYDDNRGGLYLYTLRYGEEKYFNTVLGTKIFSTVAGHKYKILSRYTVAEDKVISLAALYLFELCSRCFAVDLVRHKR